MADVDGNPHAYGLRPPPPPADADLRNTVFNMLAPGTDQLLYGIQGAEKTSVKSGGGSAEGVLDIFEKLIKKVKDNKQDTTPITEDEIIN
jgi:hypothetical protein